MKYTTLILTVTCHGCGTWCLSLTDEHLVRSVTFAGSKEDDVTEVWKQLLDEKIHCLFSSLWLGNEMEEV